jgi:hypothetical protein
MHIKPFLTILLLLLNCSIKAQKADTISQKEVAQATKTDTSPRKLRPSPIYVDGSLGLNLLNLHFMGDASVGYRINENLGVGATFISMGDYNANATGGGAQLRWTPQRNVLLKIDVGVVRGAGSVDRSGPEVYTYVKKASDTYFRIGVFFRFGQVLTLGVCYAKTSPVTFDISTLVSGQTIPIPTNRSWSYSLGAFTPQIGIAIPDMPKKERMPKIF